MPLLETEWAFSFWFSFYLSAFLESLPGFKSLFGSNEGDYQEFLFPETNNLSHQNHLLDGIEYRPSLNFRFLAEKEKFIKTNTLFFLFTLGFLLTGLQFLLNQK